MKTAIILGLLSAVVAIKGCTLQPSTASTQSITGKWYEKASIGDWWMQFLFKCITVDIRTDDYTSAVTKTRSYILKLFPWHKWSSSDALTYRGTTWEIKSNWWFSSSEAASILSVQGNIMMVKTCPKGLFAKERILIYKNSNTDFTTDEINNINSVLSANQDPTFSNFNTISQSGC